jgi:HD-GYP domain-containing protein (c-di-GMP phosphodiesterase class II)
MARLTDSQAEVAVDAFNALTAVLNPRVQDHEQATGRLATSLARQMMLSAECTLRVELAAHLHDIGLNGIDVRILDCDTPLSEYQRNILQLHCQRGEQIVRQLPELKDIAPIIRSHHERIDGTGYPDGISGDEIPIESRVIAVADAFITMTTPQIWASPLLPQVAINELLRCAGSQFEASVVGALCKLLGMTGKASPEALQSPA